jgi:hypothetical protein
MMKINLSKRTFTSEEIGFITKQLKAASKLGYLKSRKENNPYLLVSYKGVEHMGISPKWNVKIYTYSEDRRGHSIVCVDMLVLDRLIRKEYDSLIPPELPVIRIDDAEWRFPLCGVMVGVSDEENVYTAVVPVEYFRHDTRNHAFHTKQYLKEYTRLALGLLNQLGVCPGTHRIEICSGFVNQPVREKLRRQGYDVRVVEIKGLLQERLLYKAYVIEEIGRDIYYDPKDMEKARIPKRYYECLEFGKKHCPDKIKSGWKAIRGLEECS